MTALARFGWVGIGILMLLAAPGRSQTGESAEVLFPFSGMTQVRLSPTGSWIAATGHRDKISGVMVQRIGFPKIEVIVTSRWVGPIAWEGADTVIVPVGDASGSWRVFVGRLRFTGDRIEVDKRWITAPGWLVDPLPLAEGQVIWEFEIAGRNSIHRVPLEDLVDWYARRRGTSRSIRAGEKLGEIRGSAHRWIVDRDGTPQAAWRRDENGYSILTSAGAGRPLEEVYRYLDGEPEREVIPVAHAKNGGLVVLAYGDGDRRGLYEFDPRSGVVGKPIFVHDEVDVADLQTDGVTGELVAAIYGESGETRFHYFPEYRDAFLSRIDAAWKAETIAVVSAAADRSKFVFLVSGSTNPGDFYFQSTGGKPARVAQIAVEVDRERLAPVKSFHVKSRDGTQVEAFLSIPRAGEGPAPLVVMPHGGPIGVHDSREYDPLVQYLASWGFAVVQVNYRGSSGYGLAFEKLGKKQWARGIEDDIDAAVEHAMTLSEIDEDRVCIVGGSYGGFSALASVIRQRGRYRCAITLNGVTDIPLLYDSSEGADSKRVMEFYQEYVGDLATERDKLIEVSPVYHAADLDAPILVVHGTADRRVDPDHAHRLLLMLELYAKEYETVTVRDAEHSFDRGEWLVVARAARRFLTKHLMPDVTFAADPLTVRNRDDAKPESTR